MRTCPKCNSAAVYLEDSEVYFSADAKTVISYDNFICPKCRAYIRKHTYYDKVSEEVIVKEKE